MFRSVFEKIRAISFAFMHINSAHFCPDPALKIAYRARHTKLCNKQSLHKNVLLCVNVIQKDSNTFLPKGYLKRSFQFNLILKNNFIVLTKKQQQINKHSDWQKRGGIFFE